MLIDRFNRRIEYLRISVIDRCDLRCTYCIPKGFKSFEEPKSWLNFDEITQIVRVFASLGTYRFRLTGGEPLLRKDLPSLIRQLANIPNVSDLSLSTNATQLAHQAQALKAAGLSRINVSLDSLDSKEIQRITGKDCLPDILAGLEAAKQAGFDKIKINTVALETLNAEQLERLIRFCIENQFVLRLIENMPLGETGQQTHGKTLDQILPTLVQNYQLQPANLTLGGGPARYWQTPDLRFSLGIITPISQHFCATCNRVRLSATGQLYMCLGQNEQYDLGAIVKSGVSDQTLATHIRAAIELKPERHEFIEDPQKIIRIMAKTGG